MRKELIWLLITALLLAGPAAAQESTTCAGAIADWAPLVDGTSGTFELCVPATWADGSAFPQAAQNAFSCEFTQGGTRMPDITGLSPGDKVSVPVDSQANSEPVLFNCQIKIPGIWVAGVPVSAEMIFPGASIGAPERPAVAPGG